MKTLSTKNKKVKFIAQIFFLLSLLMFSSVVEARRNKGQIDDYMMETEPLYVPSPKIKFQNGYLRKDGTYVSPHYKTEKNKTKRDNFSTYPNINPNTGKTGSKKFQQNI